MGAGQSDLYDGTYGDNPDNVPDELKEKVKLPENDSQLKHIFRDSPGHLLDTSENRKMLLDLANDSKYHIGKDVSNNLDWNSKLINDGKSQLWVSTKNGVVQNGGVNTPPIKWDIETGFSYNPRKGEK